MEECFFNTAGVWRKLLTTRAVVSMSENPPYTLLHARVDRKSQMEQSTRNLLFYNNCSILACSLADFYCQ